MSDDIFGEELLRPMDVEINQLIPGNEYKVSIKTSSVLNPINISFKGEYIGSNRRGNLIKFYVYKTTDPNDDNNKVIKELRGKLVEQEKYEVTVEDINIKNIEEDIGSPILKGGKKRIKSRRSRRTRRSSRRIRRKSRRY